MTLKIISADSHICEVDATYKEIDPKFKDRAPYSINSDQVGAAMVLEGQEKPVALGIVCAAGFQAEDIAKPRSWEELHQGGWDPTVRLADQDKDGVSAEVLYPSVGMLICNNKDIDFKKACFDAYNRWLAEYCSHAPDRLIGLGQITVRTIEEGIKEMEEAKNLGFRGVMMSGNPHIEDYDHTCYDPLWEASVAMDMPIHFHILTDKSSNLSAKLRGPKICNFLHIIRGNQDIMAMMVFSGVFERFPKLKVVCAEADAGWLPHFLYRMDHAYDRHRFWLGNGIPRFPSEYFKENIYLTFQDDYVAGNMHELGEKYCNMDRLMWASDFPHSDATWPDSQKVIAEMTANMSPAHKQALLHDNAADLYKIAI